MSNTEIKDKVVPLIDKSMPKNQSKYKAVVTEFMANRNKSMFSTMPVDRIFYGVDNAKKLFGSLEINEKDISGAIANTYFGRQSNFNPRAAKDPLTILALSIVRYFVIKKDVERTKLAAIYLAFSGKFYPSIHYGSFNIVPQDYVMEWVVNNGLNKKFILKSQGSVFGAILSICTNWLSSYGKRFRDFEDDDVVYLISQLHSRIRSFMINIARVYYPAYENKDYMTYNSDNDDPDEYGGKYHLAQSDSFKAEKCIQKTMTYLVSSGIDYKLCKMCTNETVHTEEIKSIMESILNDKKNIVIMRRAISILVYTYFAQSTEKNILTMNFIAYCVTPKPNTKDENIIELKKIIDDWLNANSVLYRKRKHRVASRNNYNKSVLMYIAMCIFNANK